jgi:aspartyl aminopeptidase
MVEQSSGQYVGKLVKIDESILRIPTLAIHLDRGVNDGFTFNKETHLNPVLATVSEDLNIPEPKEDKNAPHHPNLIRKIADKLEIDPKSIKDFELCLYDTQLSTTGGINNEFIFSPRLDNLCMSYTCLEGLLTSLEEHSLDKDSRVRMICLFDNEEVGSMSAYGADSLMLETTLRRLQSDKENPTAFEESVHHSYLISADMAHAVHPNYSEKHEKNHRPKLHAGVVIKINANQRYATTSSTSLLLKHIAEQKSIPLQEFVVRNDSPCGSTIGPILSSKLGLRTIDVGCPQLSMHSIRETCGTEDIAHAVDLFKEFFGKFEQTDNSILVD